MVMGGSQGAGSESAGIGNEMLGNGGIRVYPGISTHVSAEIRDFNSLLSEQRRERQIPSTVAPVNSLEMYTQLSSHSIHKDCKPGILSVDIHPSKNIIASGGNDTDVVLFDQSEGKILSSLNGHSQKVNCVKFVPRDGLIVSGSADKTVRVWQANEDGDQKCQHILEDHTDEVKAVAIQATNNYFVTASLDNTWCFYDLSSGLCLTKVGVRGDLEPVGYTSAAFHPDGLIMSTGSSEALVQIWDVRHEAEVIRFSGHAGPVTAISFSENGYFMATAAHDGVKLWDLRKLKNFRTFAPDDSDTPTSSVDFDHSGSYLAMAGSDVRVHEVAKVSSAWHCIKTFQDFPETGKATCLKFGSDAKYIAVGSTDSKLRFLG